MVEHWNADKIIDQRGRTAIVTGANSGIGFETARELATHGARVILACRSAERGGAAIARIRAECQDARAETWELDLARLDSVKAFAERLAGEQQQIDLLVANAGVMMPRHREQTADGFELQMGVNHLGHFALVGRLLPSLLAAPSARVIVVSSLMHRVGRLHLDDLHWERRRYLRAPSYAASKLANLLFMFELERRLRRAGTRALAAGAHPGWSSTNLQRDTPLYRFFGPLAMSAARGALPVLYAATAEGVAGGDYYGPDGPREVWGWPGRAASSRAARSQSTATELWELSERATGVRFEGL